MADSTCRRPGRSIDAASIERFATAPYDEIAAEILESFLDAGELPADLRELTAEAYATFRHPAVVPARRDRPAPLHPRALPRPHAELQGRRHADHGAHHGRAAQAARQARDHRRRHLGRHRLGRHRGVPRPRQHRHLHPAPQGPHLGDPAPADDHGARRQRPQHRARRHLRRLPGPAEEAVRQRAASATASASPRVNSINFGRIAAQIAYYFKAAAQLGAPHRRVSFTVPTGNFGDIFAGYAAKRMGLPIERLVIATNSNDILYRTLKTGRYEVRDVVPTTSPSMDIQVSSNFERLLFEATGRDGDARQRPDAGPRAVRRLHHPRHARSPASAPSSPPARSTRPASRPPSPRRMSDAGYLLDPHTAVGVAVANHQLDAERRADGDARHRPSRQIPRRGQGRDGH